MTRSTAHDWTDDAILRVYDADAADARQHLYNALQARQESEAAHWRMMLERIRRYREDRMMELSTAVNEGT